MDSIPGVRNIRLTLRLGAAVFGLSALGLIAVPALFLELLNLQNTTALAWSLRMIGITLLALTGNMFIISFLGSQIAVRAAGWVMMLAAFGLGAITLMIPTGYNWFNLSYAAVGFAFSVLYLSQVSRSVRVD